MSGVFPEPSSSNEAKQWFPISLESKPCEFQWNGAVHDESTRFVIHWMEERLEALNSSTLQRKRIVRVAIEMLQNLHHHAVEPKAEVTFAVHEQSNSHWILFSKNCIPLDQCSALNQRWESLKALCNQELRKQQRNQIASDDRSLHGGGGVGLNEIIRKSEGNADMLIVSGQSQAWVTFIAELPLFS